MDMDVDDAMQHGMQKVYEVIHKNKGCTAPEIGQACHGIDSLRIAPILQCLKNNKKVKTGQSRTCSITGSVMKTFWAL